MHAETAETVSKAEAAEPGAGPAPVVAIADVRRTFSAGRGKTLTALDGVSLVVPRGAWVALLGPNGAGKSTLLALLCGMDAPDEGSVRVLGADARTGQGRAEIRRGLGMVFQSPSLDRLLSVRENLVLHGRVSGMTASDASARAEQIAANFGIAERLESRVGTLSGGLARRVDLARALLPAPRLLLLDEPSAGLDPASREGLLSLLASSRGERSELTIVMSTHMMDEAERADRVVMMAGGRIVEDGAPAALRQRAGAALVRVREDTWPAEAFEGLAEVQVVRRGGWVMATSRSSEAVEAVAGALARRGIAFEFGPPSLGDLYLSVTGTPLQEEPSR